jgi:hypothetical protein
VLVLFAGLSFVQEWLIIDVDEMGCASSKKLSGVQSAQTALTLPLSLYELLPSTGPLSRAQYRNRYLLQFSTIRHIGVASAGITTLKAKTLDLLSTASEQASKHRRRTESCT